MQSAIEQSFTDCPYYPFFQHGNSDMKLRRPLSTYTDLRDLDISSMLNVARKLVKGRRDREQLPRVYLAATKRYLLDRKSVV